jgi:hypothetical protein
MAKWQRLGRRKISCDFSVLGRVIRKRGRFADLGSSGDDRRVVVICLTLMTSKLSFASPSDISTAGVLRGRWRMTALIGLSDLVQKVK